MPWALVAAPSSQRWGGGRNPSGCVCSLPPMARGPSSLSRLQVGLSPLCCLKSHPAGGAFLSAEVKWVS